jgi:hypothetical protein
MKLKKYDRAEALRAEFAPEDSLLRRTRVLLAEAETPHEAEAIKTAAYELAGDDEALNTLVAGLNSEPERFTVYDDERGRSLSVDDLVSEAPDSTFAKAAKAVRNAGSAAEGYEILAAAMAPGVIDQWSETELVLLESLRHFDLVDDGTLPTAEERDRAQHDARLAEAAAELAPQEPSRAQQLIAAEIAAMESAANAEPQEGTSDAA